MAQARLELAWDRDATDAATPSQHVLRIRVQLTDTAGSAEGQPLCIAIALDTSMSMAQDGRIDRARQACLAVVEKLRPADRFSLAGFGSEVRELLRDLSGGAAALPAISEKIALLEPFGVTRADLALVWLQRTLHGTRDCTREAVLITDGRPTSEEGYPLAETAPLIEQARALAAEGITLSTVGLGDALNFNTDFLVTLSTTGLGDFLYAAEPAELNETLNKRFRRAQQFGLSATELTLTPLSDGVSLDSACRIRPDYAEAELIPLGHGALSLLAGALGLNVPTDFLLRVGVPAGPLGTAGSSLRALRVTLSAGGNALASAETSAIEYTDSYARRQRVDREIERDRQLWEMNEYARELQRADNPRQTALLLTNIENAAHKAGAEDIAGKAAEQLRGLRETGVLTRHNATSLLADVKHKGDAE